MTGFAPNYIKVFPGLRLMDLDLLVVPGSQLLTRGDSDRQTLAAPIASFKSSLKTVFSMKVLVNA